MQQEMPLEMLFPPQSFAMTLHRYLSTNLWFSYLHLSAFPNLTQKWLNFLFFAINRKKFHFINAIQLNWLYLIIKFPQDWVQHCIL